MLSVIPFARLESGLMLTCTYIYPKDVLMRYGYMVLDVAFCSVESFQSH